MLETLSEIVGYSKPFDNITNPKDLKNKLLAGNNLGLYLSQYIEKYKELSSSKSMDIRQYFDKYVDLELIKFFEQAQYNIASKDFEKISFNYSKFKVCYNKGFNFFKNSKFKDCKFEGSFINQSTIYDKIVESKFIDCIFKKTNFFDSRIEKIVFQNCDFEGASFEKCRMSSIIFLSCSFTKTNFLNASFEEINFQDCNFNEANFQGSEFYDNINFSQAIRPGKSQSSKEEIFNKLLKTNIEVAEINNESTNIKALIEEYKEYKENKEKVLSKENNNTIASSSSNFRREEIERKKNKGLNIVENSLLN